MIGNGKKKKKKKKSDPCSKLWADKKAEYLKKEGGAQEWSTEKDEYYCTGTEIKLRPTDDADRPLTDAEIKAKKGPKAMYASSGDRFSKRPKKKKKR